MAIQPTQPQGIGGVLDTAFQLYKATLGAVWPLALLVGLLSLAPLAYVMFTGMPAFDPTGTTVPDMSMFNNLLIAILASMVLSTWGTSALFLKQEALGTGSDMTIGTALQMALQRLPALIVAVILYMVAISVGLVLLVVPGLILMLTLLMYMAVMLFEQKGPIEGLVGSHRLVWGNWWRTCAILSLTGILMLVIYFAVAFVLGLLSPFVGMALGNAFLVSMGVQVLSQAVMNVLVMPFTCAVFIAIYWDLKLRKQGGDLAARVNALSPA